MRVNLNVRAEKRTSLCVKCPLFIFFLLSIKTSLCKQIVVEHPNIRIHENPLRDSRAISRLHTAGERNFDDRSQRIMKCLENTDM